VVEEERTSHVEGRFERIGHTTLRLTVLGANRERPSPNGSEAPLRSPGMHGEPPRGLGESTDV
jgi:hypothetical protein